MQKCAILAEKLEWTRVIFWKGLLEWTKYIQKNQARFGVNIDLWQYRADYLCNKHVYTGTEEWSRFLWFYSNHTHKHIRAVHYSSATDTVNVNCTQKFVEGMFVGQPEQTVCLLKTLTRNIRGEEKWNCGNFHHWHMSCETETELCLVKTYQLSTLRLRLYSCFVRYDVIHLFTDSPAAADPEQFERLSNGRNLS
jgi:hypothetical protein